MTDERLWIRFDGPPSHNSGRFIELETETGRSIGPDESRAGWYLQNDGTWLLGPFSRVDEAAPSTDEGEARWTFVPFSAGSGTSSAPERRCELCGRPEHGSAACSSLSTPPPARKYPVCSHCLGLLVHTADPRECQVLRAHALVASDYPSLAAVWDNPEDEAAYDVSEEAKAIIRAPLEERIRDLQRWAEIDHANLEAAEERIRELEAVAFHTDGIVHIATERIETLEAENERLREALRRYLAANDRWSDRDNIPDRVAAANEYVDALYNLRALATHPSSTEGTKAFAGRQCSAEHEWVFGSRGLTARHFCLLDAAHEGPHKCGGKADCWPGTKEVEG